MRKLTTWGLLLVLSFTMACSMSAKTEKEDHAAGTVSEVADGAGEVITLTKAEFLTKVFNYEKNPNQWVYEGTKPCIIDFYADWCGPCRQVAPVLKELAGEYKGKIIIYKINVDKEKELAAVFGVQSTPTFLFVPAKGQPQLGQGALPKEMFKEQIDKFLLGK